MSGMKRYLEDVAEKTAARYNVDYCDALDFLMDNPQWVERLDNEQRSTTPRNGEVR